MTTYTNADVVNNVFMYAGNSVQFTASKAKTSGTNVGDVFTVDDSNKPAPQDFTCTAKTKVSLGWYKINGTKVLPEGMTEEAAEE